MNYMVKIDINCPKNKVWQAIIDIKNAQNMISAILDLEVISQPKDTLVGLKWIETREMFGKKSSETMWITDYKDEEFYSTRAENCGAIYTTRLSLIESDNTTTLTLSFSGTSDSIFVRCLSSIMGVFMKKSMIKLLQKDLSDIKHYVESKLD